MLYVKVDQVKKNVDLQNIYFGCVVLFLLLDHCFVTSRRRYNEVKCVIAVVE